MSASPAPLRLPFLDGLRGAAALYVVLFHEVLNAEEAAGELSRPVEFVQALLYRGHYAVVFFIVLSGFSLMLPVARSGTGRLAGGIKDFARRRARRILPTYYGALALSLGSVGVYFLAEPFIHFGRTPIEHVFEPGTIISHLLLVHNLSFDWVYKINSPMWSVATEWQIYFVFALFLLPLWRAAGNLVTVAAAWTLGCLPYILLPDKQNFFWACPWLLGSFAFGMLGAALAFSPSHHNSHWKRVPPLVPIVLSIALVGYAERMQQHWNFLVVDAAVSLCAFSLINLGVATHEKPTWFLKIFGSKPLVALGGFSYSLYLVQHPFLTLAKTVLNRAHVGKQTNLIIEWIVLTPLTLVVCWIFAQFFEKPFTRGRYAVGRTAEVSEMLPVLADVPLPRARSAGSPSHTDS